MKLPDAVRNWSPKVGDKINDLTIKGIAKRTILVKDTKGDYHIKLRRELYENHVSKNVH